MWAVEEFWEIVATLNFACPPGMGDNGSYQNKKDDITFLVLHLSQRSYLMFLCTEN
jgi:hypothetical protein